MIDRGIVEPSRSPWASNIVLVTKKDGRVRFCVDYRKLNDVTLKDAYPIPRVDDCLEALSGAKWFSSMDLNTGFWQIGMADEDKEKTAFLTSMGLYQFTVMPFGLVNAPSTFERLMEDVLRKLQWQECLVYIDDIISISSDFEEGLQRLERIFLRLQDANMKLKPSKCILFQKKVNFLGHIVSECGISTDPIKVEAVQTWPRPRTPKQVRSFLGLCSYYRRFVQGFADIARPLHKLCEKGAKFVWTEECDSSFENLKQRLCTSPILAYPISGLPFILDTDASHAAVGAVLSQVQEDAERVISYMSRAMNVHESSYCITRKELLAVITALRSFHSYLYGQEVLLRTDNSAVSWMKNLKRPTGQTARWLEELGTYNLQVIHRPGKSHSNADALSRRPCKSCERQESINQEAIIQESVEEEKSDIQEPKCDTVRVTSEEMNTSRNQAILEGWDPMSLRQKQLEDENIQPIISAFDDTGTRPPWDKVSSGSSILKTLWRQWDRLELIEGVLYRIFHEEDKTSKQIIVPKDLHGNVIKHFHDIPSAGHLGAEKTQSRLSRSFYWPNMTETISSYCKTCDKCSARNPPNKSRRAPLGQYLVGEPMERIAVDILGPLPVTAKGNRYVLVICDLFTKWTEAFAIPNQEASTVARVMIDEFICRFGTPLQIHSDQGRTFESQIFQGMCELLQIDKTRTTSQRPQANGCVERFNRTLGAMLTKYAENEQKKWDEYLPQLMMGYRSSTHSSTNATPNLLMLGRNVMMPMDAVIPRSQEHNSSIIENERENYIRELQTTLTKAHQITRKHLKKSSDYQKKHYDIKSSKRSLEIGQAVWLYDATRKVGVCHKLTSKWKGPYLVVKKIDDLTYMISCNVSLVPRGAPIQENSRSQGPHKDCASESRRDEEEKLREQEREEEVREQERITAETEEEHEKKEKERQEQRDEENRQAEKRDREAERKIEEASFMKKLEEATLRDAKKKLEKEERSRETPTQSSVERAKKLLSLGCMPLFPAARREWDEDEAIEISTDPSIRWPPTSWRDLDEEEKLTAWVSASAFLEAKSGRPLMTNRGNLLDKYSILALPGTLVTKGKSHSYLRLENFNVIRNIAIGKIVGREAYEYLKIYEEASKARNTDVDWLVEKSNDIPLRLLSSSEEARSVINSEEDS
ncbi:hypothetical protein FSP39_023509 [Pinctada imbricata]|uniref:Uncharacterized protein n=1 Tax=Pinctada imbricata TaxID=66713 RepID=A0AA89C9D5_PINIB|nr:hypothetical protein FSP39_023509 [Pinctada imbricata]